MVATEDDIIRCVKLATDRIKEVHKEIVAELMPIVGPLVPADALVDTVVNVIAQSTLGLGVTMCEESGLDVRDIVERCLAINVPTN